MANVSPTKLPNMQRTYKDILLQYRICVQGLKPKNNSNNYLQKFNEFLIKFHKTTIMKPWRDWIWINTLKIGDKIDFFQQSNSQRRRKWLSKWNCGVIMAIQKHGLTDINFVVSQKDCSKYLCISISFFRPQSITNKIAKFNTHTISYIHNDNIINHYKLLDNCWLKSVKINDKLDVYCRHTKMWRVATVIKIQKKERFNNTKYRFAFYFDQYCKSKWIEVNYAQGCTLSELAPLHTHSAYHNDEKTTCFCLEWVVCVHCNKKLCTNCFPSVECRNCMVENEKKIICSTIKDSECIIKCDYIIALISQYAAGYIIDCFNKNICNNEIIIENKWDFTMKNEHDYYEIDEKFVDDRDINHITPVYGKYKRFSCVKCHEKLMSFQSNCANNNMTYFCFNHTLCSLCGGKFDKHKENKCKNYHYYCCGC
eukprot:411781_1